MSVDPARLAAVSGTASSQTSQARKTSGSDYDPGPSGFAQTLAERRQANQPAGERADNKQTQPARAGQTENRTEGARHAADSAGKQTQRPAKHQTQDNGDSSTLPARAQSRQPVMAEQAAGKDAATVNAAGKQAPADTPRLANPKADAGEDVKIAKAMSTNEGTSDDSRPPHAARDEALARDGEPLADNKAPQPLIGLIDPAPLAQNIRMGPRGNVQSDEARVTSGGGERRPAGSALQARARAGAEPQLQRADLASTLGRDTDSIGFARHVQRVITRTADGAGARGLGQDAGSTPSSLAGLASTAHVSSPATASAASPAPAAGAVFTAALDAPVGSDVWSQAVTRQSLRLSHADGGRAELTLYPRDLGQLQISLKMGEQAQLHFSSPHAHVRAAVESALPQLRHAFAESGIALGDTSVSDQRPQQNFSNERRRPPSADAVGAVAATAESGIATAATSVPVTGHSLAGGIDIFA
ncbi:flagellar hook-length control protein FliK [Salinisphaera aquimarina]|uniref:Flagellar hook-length control protein FliK n=1 Tax=Salinisphaera aquimarina TaxID=2094031 RepID=A0ABV7EN80_9GAMM